MNINNNHFSSIRQVQETYFQNQPGISRKNSETAASFQEILKQKSEAAGTENKPLKFSRHADARMADRNISLTKEQLDRLEQGTKKGNQRIPCYYGQFIFYCKHKKQDSDHCDGSVGE